MKHCNTPFGYKRVLRKIISVFIISASNHIVVGQEAPVIQPLPTENLQVGISKIITVSAQAVHPVDTNNLKIVVLGSSTAEGLGASDPATTAWVPLLASYMSSAYPGSEVVNLGKAGFTSYRILPTGTSTPTGHEPNQNRNITKAISLNPDIILINLPSNDVDKGIASSVTIDNLNTVKQLAEQEGIVVYITTTQPRHSEDFTTQMRLRLEEQAQLIRNDFGSDVIDIYDELATADNEIKPIYDSGDHIHLSDPGHEYIFNTIKPKLDSLIKENIITLTASNLPDFASAVPAGNGKLNIIFFPEINDTNSRGTVNITVINGNGVSSQIAFDYQVPRISQTLTMADLEDRVFGDTSFELSATASSGLPASFIVVSGPATITGNLLKIEGTGIVIVQAMQPGNENYQAAEPVERSFEVEKAPQIISFLKPADKTYPQTSFSLEGTASSGLPVSFRIISGSAIIDTLHEDRAILHFTGTGTVRVKAEQLGNINFESADPVEQNFILHKAFQTIEFDPIENKKSNNAPFALQAISSGGLPVSFSVASGPATISGNTVTLTGEGGDVIIIASQEGSENYEPAPDIWQSFTVTALKAQSITFNPIGDHLRDDPAFAIEATSIAGLPVTLEIVSGPASINDNIITLNGTGIIVVRAIQEGDDDFLPAGPVERSFKVEEVTGIADDIAGAGIKIFPNPVTTDLYLETNIQRWYGAEIYIKDAWGRNVAFHTLEAQQLHIDLSGKSAGMYMIVIRKNNNFFAFKFVKE